MTPSPCSLSCCTIRVTTRYVDGAPDDPPSPVQSSSILFPGDGAAAWWCAVPVLSRADRAAGPGDGVKACPSLAPSVCSYSWGWGGVRV